VKRVSLGALTTALSISVTAVVACTTTSRPIGELEAAESPSFTPTADGGDVSEAGLTEYCPTNNCPPGWTTCPTSRFPCDVNLLADPSNCGACGNACSESTHRESFSCVEGACVMKCNEGMGAFDCDGQLENGCETMQPNNAHCGACGNGCPADMPCSYQTVFGSQVACGCPAGQIDCFFGCSDLSADDSNCGGCWNWCDPTGGAGAPQYSNMYYGCLDNTCGNLKCEPNFRNCDSILENGCETSLVSDDNCGACGNVCPAGQHCYLNADKQRVPECMCDGDLTLCDVAGSETVRYCADLRSDDFNCGACGVSCAPLGHPPGARRRCDFGACVTRCMDGYADCNGNEADGCETDTTSDPRNCGGCGIVCDAIAGQACVAGMCVVAPCDQIDAGELTR